MKRWIGLLMTLSLLCGVLVLPGTAYSVTDGADVAYAVASESMVLLKNENNALPLQKTDKIALFGEGQVFTDGKTGGFYLMGRGSGYVLLTETPKSPCDVLLSYVKAGKLGGVYEPLMAAYKKATGGKTDTSFSYEPTDEDYINAAAYADKAIYIIERTSAEGSDLDASYFGLTGAETRQLRAVCKAFAGKPVIVVLNAGYPIGCGFANGRVDGIYADAVLTAPYMGVRGVDAFCRTLIGEINPSGKTTDTYAKALADYPSAKGFASATYYEDIYVGYRYFETFGIDVDYEFGYGLSYTDFELSGITYAEKDGGITVMVTVQNVGDVAGKEVVQVYFSAPQKGTGGAVLSKAAKELCGFAKTDLLAPGEKQTLNVTFDVSDMASYDDLGVTGHKSAYVLEAGDYTVYAGTSVKNLSVAGTHKEPALRVVEQCSMLCEPIGSFERMTFDGTETVGKVYASDTEILHKPTAAKQTENERVIRFAEVLSGKTTMQAFLAQMSDDELCTVAVMTRALGVTGGTGAWGASVEVAEKYGIPVADTADGPAGLRISTKATGMPCSTAVANTWNLELVRQAGAVIAAEALRSGVDVWLAPGVNLHRYPLCGRNFEYYSEDPYLSGAFAAALIQTVEAHGIATSVKHFVCNEKESGRNTSNSVISERALRELYLKPFRMAVDAGVSTVMTSYNKLNGAETSENAELLRGILRGEWGFTGVITTDWTNNSALVREIAAGNNVKSSGSEENLTLTALQAAVRSGTVSRSLLIENATYMMQLLAKLPDGRRLAAPPVVTVLANGTTVFQAEDYTLKHGHARQEISGSTTVMAYMSADGNYLPWLEYTLDVEQGGVYQLSVGLANNSSTGNSTKDTVSVFVNGVKQDVSLNSASTGGWYKVALRTAGNVILPKGRVILRIQSNANTACGNFDAFRLQPVRPADTVLQMQIGSTAYTLSGVEQRMDVAPVICEGRTMLPARYVAESFGASVTWDGATSTATVTGADGTVIRLTVGAPAATVNGERVALDAPAFLAQGRTFVPVRFLAESLGAEVFWDGASSTATMIQ